ncbi:sugar ABC transporter ATP-binding protein [Nocardiopsis ansamitocini]|uniref:Ribose import ATP-binding protein RbsA n=1 Tax=Nocardiopsis ansamitocini TaxID=1670832 RepID=A0A9W6UH10_9ACTN|nr:sugar ABC transporter ATP-binding protein [Nocardiopsis ansamitocini]GLU46247.1 ribose import ATP-binding protein RbsA [Nocardiopsis ansamitocini]
MASTAFLEMTGVRKRYGGVTALDGADFAAEAGTVHAVLGPNGSGKSTLLKVLTGVVAPDEGEVRLNGRALRPRGPRDTAEAGISAVYQELSLIDDFSVLDNLVLGVEPRKRGVRDRAAARRLALPWLERFAEAFGGRVPVDERVADLDPGERQVVEVCKALVRQPRVLVLDEATASLRRRQVEVLFDVVRELRESGVLVLFITHRLAEILAVCDRATIMRNGSDIRTVTIAEVPERDLVELMVGELAAAESTESSATDEVRLDVDGLSAGRLHDATFQVRAGEVLGLGGLQGQGQSHLLSALFGALKPRAGTITLDGETVQSRSPKQAVRAKIAYVPGDRGSQGLALGRPILENFALPSAGRRAWLGIGLSRKRELAAARAVAERISTRYGSLDDPVSTLSGGNQQKIVVGKWFPTEPRVVLMDDPAKGIDVRAKAELFHVVRELAASGAAVLISASDDRELVELCDRVLVLFEGRIVDEVEGDRLTEETLVSSAMHITEADRAVATTATADTDPAAPEREDS